ncbi:formin-like protein 7, partial [Punica granatum]|uniref:Formin-like protein 7 n=1 Tax=Punica granatum TaxID=22663 RepID=A0A6P8BZM0_PUNGR
MEDPTNKGEESSKKAPAAPSSSSGRRAKEVSVNAVNTAHKAPQQYSVNLTTAPTTAPTYFPPPPQHQLQSIYYSAPPVPPPTTSQSYDHFTPAPAQPSQPRPPVSRTPPPTQQNPASQGQQAGGAPSQPRKQYSPLLAPFSHIYWQLLAGDQIQPISPGPNFDPSVRDQSKRCEYHQGTPGPSINMISVCVSERDEETQGTPPPFVINYTPEELTVEFTGHAASPAPFVVDVPAREPYSDSKVPWTYEGSIGSVEQQFSVMGLTRSGRVDENPTAKDKGKAPAVGDGATPERSPFPSKK